MCFLAFFSHVACAHMHGAAIMISANLVSQPLLTQKGRKGLHGQNAYRARVLKECANIVPPACVNKNNTKLITYHE